MTDVTTARARALAASALRNADVMFGADRALDRGGGSNWRARDGSDGSAEAARTSLRVKIANEYASVRTLARENELAGSKGEDGGRGRSGRGSSAAAEAPVKVERKRKKEPSDIA